VESQDFSFDNHTLLSFLFSCGGGGTIFFGSGLINLSSPRLLSVLLTVVDYFPFKTLR